MPSFYYNGLTYEYDNNTRFIMQIGRYKNRYLTKMVQTGEYQESINAYESLQVSNGYKKRLIMVKDNKKTTVAYYISERP